MMRAFAATGLLLAALALPPLARADVIHLKTGRVEGTVVEETETELVIQTKVGKVTVRRGDVERIEKKASPLETYRELAAKVADDDADGHFSLGRWCTDHRLYSQARQEYEKTVAISPDHAGARERLGYVRKDGKWMTRTEAKRADGYVRHEGKWITAEERQAKLEKQAIVRWMARLRRAVGAGPMTADLVEDRLRAAFGRKEDDSLALALCALLRSMTHEANDSKRDRTIGARIALLKLIAERESEVGLERIRRTAIVDYDKTVREAALAQLAPRKDIEDTAFFVALLRKFTGDRYRVRGTKKTRSLARRVMRRVGRALEVLGDPRALPALAHAMIVRFHIPENKDEIPPMSLGFSTGGLSGPATVVTDGHGNQFVVPVTENSNWGLNNEKDEQEIEDFFFFNEAAYNALRHMTGEDFGHDKRAWLAWWYRNRHRFER